MRPYYLAWYDFSERRGRERGGDFADRQCDIVGMRERRRRDEGERVHFLLVSLWDSRDAIAAYAGPDIDQACYFPFDRECLIAPESRVAHYEVLASSPATPTVSP